MWFIGLAGPINSPSSILADACIFHKYQVHQDQTSFLFLTLPCNQFLVKARLDYNETKRKSMIFFLGYKDTFMIRFFLSFFLFLLIFPLLGTSVIFYFTVNSFMFVKRLPVVN